MKKIVFFILLFIPICALYAQQKTIRGTIMSKTDNLPLPGVSVLVEGTKQGTQTNNEGIFTLQVPPNAVLLISYIGHKPYRFQTNAASEYTIMLEPDDTNLDEVVVTALGITREKRSLGYASQAISAEDVGTVKTGNVTNAISGKIAGVQVRRNPGMGASTNIVIRGFKSLTGNNQALFVVDGVPIDNRNIESSNSGYDYGNLASDINPDDVESINVLKGAAATALYGSRAANGAVIITTKKGAKGDKVNISVSSDYTVGYVDPTTFPKFQQQYGGGYGRVNGAVTDAVKNGYFDHIDVNGDGVLDSVVSYGQYGSWGAPYDPNLMVYQWTSVDPQSPLYGQATPWVAAKDTPIDFFNRSKTSTNNVSIAGSSESGTYRISYSNFLQSGIIPNSKMNRHNIATNLAYRIAKGLTASASINYVKTDTKGRTENGTGNNYTSPVITLRNYWQNNINLSEVKSIYEQTGRNVTPFPGGTIDNPYYIVNEMRQSDSRDRIFGNVDLKYAVTDWLSVEGRASLDTYSYIQEDRRNTMLRVPSLYAIRNITASERNFDLMVNFNKNIGEDFNINALVGGNIRRNLYQSIYNSTNGGLLVQGIYAIANSVGTPTPADETYTKTGVNGIYGTASLGYKNMIYVDLTGRSDHSSTLPVGNNTYFYPSATLSFVFSELLKDHPAISFGKFRINYAKVGNDAPAVSLLDVLNKPTPFGTTQLFSVNGTKNNPDLKPESTKSVEAGLEMSFFNRRLGFDFSLYKTNTTNQIVPIQLSSTSGYTRRYINAGDIQNKGIELMLNGTPVKTGDFSWDITVNWAKNVSKVVSLMEGLDNLQLGSYINGVTLNAMVGQPYGVLYGTDFVYVNGKRLINQETGEYVKTSTNNNVLGKVTPDWTGGITNKFHYKSFDLSFLIDMQKGGSIYSLDMATGGFTQGMYENTAFINDLGNPVRNSLADGGGMILDGVDENGNPNTIRVPLDSRTNALSYTKAPNKLAIYDASYIKLRELSLYYSLPTKWLSKAMIKSAQIGLVGSNLWIIHKNLPYADPEAGLISGNQQGYQMGVYPATRNIGISAKLQF